MAKKYGLDHAIVIDTTDKSGTCERADQIAFVVGKYSKETTRLLMDPENIAPVLEEFRTLINRLLSEKKAVVVVFNIIAGVKGQILATLLEAEERHGIGTRRILVTCKGRSDVNTGFRRRGLPRSKVRHIQHDSGEGRYMEELDALFA